MSITLATITTLAQTGIARLIKRLIEGDMMAIAVIGGIAAVLVICFVAWKLLQRSKPPQENKLDENDNLKL